MEGQKRGCWHSWKCVLGFTVFLYLIGTIFLLLGVIGPIVLNDKLQQGIRDQIIVDSFDSTGYNLWVNNTQADSPPTWTNFFLWNVTNPDEVINGAIPTINQVGPYSYRKYGVKYNVSFSSDGNLATFNLWEYWVFDPEKSFPGAKPWNDSVTIVNVPLQGVIGTLKYGGDPQDDWWKTLFWDLLISGTNSSLFVTLRPHDVIFGYNDSLLILLAKLQPGTVTRFGLEQNFTDIDTAYAGIPQTSTIYTGKNNIFQIGRFFDWRNKSSIGCWATDEANAIVGTDGTQFWNGMSQDDKPYVWVDDIFQSIYFSSNETVDVDGITLDRWRIPPEGLRNATNEPRNAAYYQFGHDGIENATRCEGGAPIFMSQPHFLGGPWYQARVNGVHPDPELHRTSLDVEPTIGTTMQASKKLQVNVQMQSDILLYPNVASDLYIPVSWIREDSFITADLASQFKGSIYLVRDLIYYVKWISFPLLVVSILTAMGFTYRVYKLRKEAHMYELVVQ